MTNQPKWKCIAQLGDVNPIDHGGAWVMIDTTGQCDPQIEILEVTNMDEDHTLRQCATITLDRCTHINGVLSDNCYHTDLQAWFSDDVPNIASCMGYHSKLDIIDLLCSSDPICLARGYRDLVDYFGIDNFGGYDILEMSRGEAKKRYSRARYKIKQ